MDTKFDDVVISSRIRLARNIDGLNFASKIDAVTARSLPHDIYSAINGSEQYMLYRMAEMNRADSEILKEKHLISDDLLHNRDCGAVIINESETISIMVNEEDHLREQCILPGLCLDEAFDKINSLDNLISKSLPFSFDKNLGYLTACPTNLGTGMRASAMVFLPGLSIYNSLEACVNAVSRLNMTIRGVYGEGSDIAGYMFQVSNQKTLGYSEEQIIDSVGAAIGHIVDAELRSRDALIKSGQIELKDKILRAYGTLTNAYKMDTKEFMHLMALLKLGVYYGFISTSDKSRIDKLITSAQPAGIASLSQKELSGTERDIMRAGYVSKSLTAFTKKN